MTPLRAGLIGLGQMGRHHARVLQQLDGVQLVAATATRICSQPSELDDGTVASHHVNWLSPLKERLTIVTGDRGCLVADTLHGDLTYYANGSAVTTWPAAQLFRGVTEGDIPRYAVEKREPLLAEHEAWCGTVLGHTAPIATLAEGAATVAIAEPRPLPSAAGRS
ncbi:hypothetical protein [Kitasatospora griseola]|uniref:hypothetical protein n=1 Tax=Kitasatospora griseola TaxID=2064 RepID=UPI00382A2869